MDTEACMDEMAREDLGRATRVYRYGCLAPIEGADVVRAQMRAAHDYRNTLVAIERGRRAAAREALQRAGNIPALEVAARAADHEASEAQRAVKAARAAGRTRKASKDLLDRLSAARATKKAAVQALREARRVAREDPAIVADLARIDALAHDLAKNARAYCGCYWGTYLRIEAAMDASRKLPLYDGIEPNDPGFVRWDGEGAVAVQVQNGLDVVDLFGDDTRLRVAPVDERAWLSPVRAERRKFMRTEVSLRVASDGRAPVWGRWPMVMHRALPEGARIKWAVVTLKKIGPREEWALLLTVEMAAPTRVAGGGGDGVIALDLGWRQRGEDLRVGVWRDERGTAGEIRLDGALLSALSYPKALQSIRDREFDAAREALVRGLATMPEVPAWLASASRTLAQWRSSARLAALAKRWRDARFEGDASLYDPLEAWRYHDHHLWVWCESQRSKSLRRRREHYRIVAADLARRYGTLVLEAFDLRAVARRPSAADDATAAAEGKQAENETARTNRQLAAVSELRLALTQAFVARGGRVVTVPAENTTRECANCGSLESWDQAASVHHGCRKCGKVWDQDDNAAENLLARWQASERASDVATPGAARSEEKPQESARMRGGRWAKVKQESAAKRALAGAARNEEENASSFQAAE